MDQQDDDDTLYEIRYLDNGVWRTASYMMIKSNAEVAFRNTKWEIVPGSGANLPKWTPKSNREKPYSE